MKIISDFNVYCKCPEIRRQVAQIYFAKLANILTLALFSPLILVGIISIGAVHVFDYLGQLALLPAHKITQWLQEYQRNQIREGHSILSIDDIQKRIGKSDEDL